MPVVKVVKVLAAGSTGTFDLKVNGTTLATGVGNGGTTGTKTVFDTSAYGAPDVTVAQSVATTAVPLTLSESERGRQHARLHHDVHLRERRGHDGGDRLDDERQRHHPGLDRLQRHRCRTSPARSPTPRCRRSSLVKSVSSVTDVNGNGQRDAGDKINYSFLVTNTGGTALTARRRDRPEGHRHQLPGHRRWPSARA